MAERRGLASTGVAAKAEDLADINALHDAFGRAAFRVAEMHHASAGYVAATERLQKKLREGTFSRKTFEADPVTGLADWMRGFFADRGGNQPEVRTEGRTVYLTTPACRTCLVVEAEKQHPTAHSEVCFVYCRAWALGYLKVFEDLYPELIIHYHNVDSRRAGAGHDCTEAFQVIWPGA